MARRRTVSVRQPSLGSRRPHAEGPGGPPRALPPRGDRADRGRAPSSRCSRSATGTCRSCGATTTTRSRRTTGSARSRSRRRAATSSTGTASRWWRTSPPTTCSSTGARRRTSPARRSSPSGVLQLPPEQVHARVERALRYPGVRAGPDRRKPRHRGGRDDRGARARSIRSSPWPSRSGASTRTASWPRMRSAISRRRRRIRSRRPRTRYAMGDWIGQKGIEATYESLLAGVNGERRVVVDSHGREIAEQNRSRRSPARTSS